MEACNAGAGQHLPVHARRRRLGRLLLVRQRDDLDAADLHRADRRATASGTVGDPTRGCTPHAGPIGTLPWYAENGLVSDGDPAVAFGPRPGPRRLQLGQRLAAVLREPDLQRRARRAPSRRSRASRRSPSRAPTTRRPPRPATQARRVDAAGAHQQAVARRRSPTRSRSGPTTPSSSPFFGTVYVCWASFRGQEKGNAAPAPLIVAVSHDGGDTWTQHQISLGGEQQPAQPDRRLHDPHRQPRHAPTCSASARVPRRQAAVRVHVASRPTAARTGRRPHAGRRSGRRSRARSTRCRAGR